MNAITDSLKPTLSKPTYQGFAREITALDIKVLEQLDFLVRASRARGGVGFAYCSQDWLSRRLGYRRESVNRSIGRLKRTGAIEVRKTRNKGRWARCRYWFSIPYLKRYFRFMRRPNKKASQTVSPCDSKSTLAGNEKRESKSDDQILFAFSRQGHQIMERWSKRGMIRQRPE